MKKLVLAVCFTFIASVSFASDICVQFANLGMNVMEARQAGVPISSVLAVIEQNSGGVTEVENIGKEIVYLAYDTPKYLTDKMKAEAGVEFGNKVYLNCVK